MGKKVALEYEHHADANRKHIISHCIKEDFAVFLFYLIFGLHGRKWPFLQRIKNIKKNAEIC